MDIVDAWERILGAGKGGGCRDVVWGGRGGCGRATHVVVLVGGVTDTVFVWGYASAARWCQVRGVGW